jgi:thioredoxin-like negative regulator of GroEL
MSKVRETNDWLLPEELAMGPPETPILVLFDESEGFKDNAMDLAFLSVALQHAGPARFFRLNIDENPSVVERYKLKRLPTVALYVDGKELGRRSGIHGDQAIHDLLARKQKPRA